MALAHVGVAVGDLDRAIGFYRVALGWELWRGPVAVAAGPQERDVLGPGVRDFRQAHLVSPGGPLLELFELPAPGPGDRWRPGLFHLCVVGDPAALERAGGCRLSRVWPHRPGAATALSYCADPWGTLIEVATHDDRVVYR